MQTPPAASGQLPASSHASFRLRFALCTNKNHKNKKISHTQAATRLGCGLCRAFQFPFPFSFPYTPSEGALLRAVSREVVTLLLAVTLLLVVLVLIGHLMRPLVWQADGQQHRCRQLAWWWRRVHAMHV